MKTNLSKNLLEHRNQTSGVAAEQGDLQRLEENFSLKSSKLQAASADVSRTLLGRILTCRHETSTSSPVTQTQTHLQLTAYNSNKSVYQRLLAKNLQLS